MTRQSYGPYRGFTIEVRVTPEKSYALGGAYRRFRVSWTVSSPDAPEHRVASFPEQFDLVSEQEAFKYGENRAHTHIDSILCTPSHEVL